MFLWGYRFFLPEYFRNIAVFSLFGEYVVYVFPYRMVFFYLVTTGWIFDISLYENSFNESINRSLRKRWEVKKSCNSDDVIDMLEKPIERFKIQISSPRKSCFWS